MKRRVLTIGLWTLTVLFVVLYILLASTYAHLLLAFRGVPPIERLVDTYTFFLLRVGGAMLAIAFILGWSRLFVSRAQPVLRSRIQPWVHPVLLILATVPLIYLAADSRPTERLYSWSDLRPPPAKAEESYELLMTYRKGAGGKEVDIGTFDLSKALTNATPYADEIEAAFQKIDEARAWMRELAQYEGIADLTTDHDSPVVSFLALRKLSHAHWAYAQLNLERGEFDRTAQILSEHHAFSRRALPYARSLVSKMVWTAVVKGGIEAAYCVARNPACSKSALRALLTAFAPIPREDTSLRDVCIAELLIIRQYFEEHATLALMPHFRGDKHRLRSRALGILSPLLLNRNRTILDLQAYWMPVIAAAAKHPNSLLGEVQKKQHRMLFHNMTAVKNLLGTTFVLTTYPSLVRPERLMIKTKIKSDLLYLEIQTRLGEPTDGLDDPCTGSPYMLDESTGLFFSPGLDGVPDTDDDITLDG